MIFRSIGTATQAGRSSSDRAVRVSSGHQLHLGNETTFADRVLPVGVPVARLWGELSAGRSLPVIDTLIAATAITRGLTLVTRNTRDVAATGVPLVDPWQGG